MLRIVCAAMMNSDKRVICSPRHFDSVAHAAISDSRRTGWKTAIQGFVDNRGNFLTREEAWPIAVAAGQIIRRVGGDEGCLYSENLY